MGTVPSTVPMSSMSTPAPLDPAQFSLRRHRRPVQNGEIFFVCKSMGAHNGLFPWFLLQCITKYDQQAPDEQPFVKLPWF